MCDVTDNKTPMRPIRVEEDLWAEFGRLVGGRNRSQVIREFIRWFVRERGAQLPTRPESASFDRPERPDRNPELTELLMQARNGLEHNIPHALGVSSDEAEGLLPRELQVFFLVTDGLSDAEIAAGLKVTPKTVKTYIRNVAAKIRTAGEAKILVPKSPTEDWAFKVRARPSSPES